MLPSPPPSPPRGRTSSAVWIVLALVFGASLGGTCATCATLGARGDELMLGGGERVGVVELIGPITDSAAVVGDLRKFADRDDLVAIVLRIDSPGGAVAPSQEIYDAMRWAARKKPVVASMGNVAASGGFWASLGADWVFASPGSITGSIGVITQTPDLRGLAELARVRFHTFKSGPLKDAGNPFREMTKQDEALFMSLIDDIYDQFVSLTAERRRMPIDEVKKIADGRILTGRAALGAGLVDELGGLHDAARKAMLMANRRRAEEEGEAVTSTAAEAELEDPTLVYPKKPAPSFLDLLSEGASSAVSRGVGDAARALLDDDPAPVELR